MAGESAECGVYFVNATGAAQRVKVEGRLADNTSRRIAGMIPALAAGQWQVEVITQFASGAVMTKGNAD